MKRHSLAQFVLKSACFSIKQNVQLLNSSIFIFKHQTNDDIFLNTTENNFNFAKIFCNVEVLL